MNRIWIVIFTAVSYATILAVMLPAEQLVEQIPVPGVPVPETDSAVREWLPGIWGIRVYEFDGEAFVPVRGFGYRYQLRIDDEGSLAVDRWRELLPRVEVAFYDGTYGVLSESWDGESREFSLDLDSVTETFGEPSFTGTVRVEIEGNPDIQIHRVVWRKLPNDFFEGPL